MGEWIRISEAFPEEDRRVLVWRGMGSGHYDIASIDGNGRWSGLTKGSPPPTYRMALPEPPPESEDAMKASGIGGKVVNNKIMLDITEDKESVAELMQCYINGEEAQINDERYLVTDIKNEIIGEKVISVFFLRRKEVS